MGREGTNTWLVRYIGVALSRTEKNLVFGPNGDEKLELKTHNPISLSLSLSLALALSSGELQNSQNNPPFP